MDKRIKMAVKSTMEMQLDYPDRYDSDTCIRLLIQRRIMYKNRCIGYFVKNAIVRKADNVILDIGLDTLVSKIQLYDLVNKYPKCIYNGKVVKRHREGKDVRLSYSIHFKDGMPDYIVDDRVYTEGPEPIAALLKIHLQKHR